MRILQNLAVHGHEWRIENTSRRDDNLVRRVAVKLAWKLSGLDADAGRKLDETDAGIRQRLLKPVEYGTRKSKSRRARRAWRPPSTKSRSPRGRSARRNQAAHGWTPIVPSRREPTKPRCAYREQSSGSLPVSVRHGFGGREKRDRGAPKRVTGTRRSNRRERKDNDLDRLAATERNVAQSDDAVLGQSSFSAVCLHGGRIKRLRFLGKRAKRLGQ